MLTLFDRRLLVFFRLVGLATANGTALELTLSLIKLHVALKDVDLLLLFIKISKLQKRRADFNTYNSNNTH